MRRLFSDVQQRWGRLIGLPIASRLPEGENKNAGVIHFCHTSVGADCHRQRKERARVGYSHLPTSETAEDRQQSPGRRLQQAGLSWQGFRSCQFVGRSGCGNQGAHEWRQADGGSRAGSPGSAETRRQADGPGADTSSHSPSCAGSRSSRIAPSPDNPCHSRCCHSRGHSGHFCRSSHSRRSGRSRCRAGFNPRGHADNSPRT